MTINTLMFLCIVVSCIVFPYFLPFIAKKRCRYIVYIISIFSSLYLLGVVTNLHFGKIRMMYWYENLFADIEQSAIRDDCETIRNVVQNYNHIYEQTHSGKQAVLSSRYLFRELTMNYQPIPPSSKPCEEVKDESMLNDESPEL